MNAINGSGWKPEMTARDGTARATSTGSTLR